MEAMRALDEETRQDFLDRLASDWEAVHAEALWVAERTGAGPRFEAQLERARELANEAVLRVVEGRRAWNRGVELRTFMGGAMRSIAAADWKRRQRHDPIADDVPDLPGRRPSERLEERLDQAEAEAVIDEVRDAATGDALCEAVVRAYLQGNCERPRHVAARLGVPEQAVYNAQRKLARRVLAARKKKLPSPAPSTEELSSGG